MNVEDHSTFLAHLSDFSPLVSSHIGLGSDPSSLEFPFIGSSVGSTRWLPDGVGSECVLEIGQGSSKPCLSIFCTKSFSVRISCSI